MSVTSVLRPYQVDDAAWLSEMLRGFLLLDQGLGKTPISIRAANLVGAKRIMVICEAVGRINWRREIKRWSTDPDLRAMVVSYDYMSSGKRVPNDVDVLILDEAQKLKTRTSKRTRAVYGPGSNGTGMASRAKYVWVLSGTLCPNGAHEMFTHLRALFPQRLPRIKTGQIIEGWRWEVAFFHTRKTGHGDSIQILGPKAGALVQIKKMMKGLVRRRLKKHTLPELPPITWSDAWVEDDEVVAELEKHPDIVALEEEIELSLLVYGDLSGLDYDSQHIATARKLIGLAKTPLAAEYIKDLLDSGAKKVIVFAYHREVIKQLAKLLGKYKPGYIMGGVSESKRQDAIDRFQDPESDCRVFIGQIVAAGTTITLTAASEEVFVESSFVPSDNAQAAARAHRIGQNNAVNARFLALSGSVDVRVMRRARLKAQQLDQFWENTEIK